MVKTKMVYYDKNTMEKKELFILIGISPMLRFGSPTSSAPSSSSASQTRVPSI